jgi:hypothetical protein
MGYDIFAPLELKAWNDFFVPNNLRTLLSSKGATIFIAHSVAPKAQTMGKIYIKIEPQRGVI